VSGPGLTSRSSSRCFLRFSWLHHGKYYLICHRKIPNRKFSQRAVVKDEVLHEQKATVMSRLKPEVLVFDCSIKLWFVRNRLLEVRRRQHRHFEPTSHGQSQIYM
jgi:hypothetical protein